MPIYEYACKKCGKTTELMRPLAKRDDRAKCASCGSTSTARKLSMFAVGASASIDIGADISPDEYMAGMGDDHGHGHGHSHDDEFGGMDLGDDFDF
ncbi:MAG: zinc ribbon domain-containing protein [Dehalococcoidia bacterium]